LNTRRSVSGRLFVNCRYQYCFISLSAAQSVCSNTVVMSTAIFTVLRVLQIWMMRIRSCGSSCPLCCKRAGRRSLSTKPSSLRCLSWDSSRRGLSLVGTPRLCLQSPVALTTDIELSWSCHVQHNHVCPNELSKFHCGI